MSGRHAKTVDDEVYVKGLEPRENRQGLEGVPGPVRLAPVCGTSPRQGAEYTVTSLGSAF